MDTSGQLRNLVTLSPAKKPPVPTEQEAGGPKSRSCHIGVEKSLLPLQGIEPKFLSRPVQSLATLPTTLSRNHRAGGIVFRYAATMSSALSSQAIHSRPTLNNKGVLRKRITVSDLHCLPLRQIPTHVLSTAKTSYILLCTYFQAQ
jgi:hypothetical protein